MPIWNAADYLRFETERTLPSRDLCAGIPLDKPQNILDVGCGPGNSTAVLRERFKSARILGIDSSEEMIKSARKSRPELDFRLLDAGKDLDKLDENYDVVFSNAVFQWIPDNKRLIKNLAALIRPGGALAVQVPYNDKAEVVKALGRTVKSPDWAVKLEFARKRHELTPQAYYDTLSKYFKTIRMWETAYYHILEKHEDFIDWYRGTSLRPYLQALSEQDQTRFLGGLLSEIRQKYPARKDGKILFRFTRLFFIAQK
ncbi:MAG: methyltransferase domain-containing protein [Clostridiales bacterium]|jgi:trans-aconitate 2-methyltransferase|nr:methyltransferase domain-containing protein [Clostridiales bacterium]